MSRSVRTIAAVAVCAAASNAFGQGATPFKLGTFDQNGRSFVGIVLKDSIVIDVAQASAALQVPASKVAAPSDMKDLIARYDSGVRARIGEVHRQHQTARRARPPGIRPRSQVVEDAAADHVPDDDAERGGELPGARSRNGRRRDDAGGRGRAGRRAARHDQRTRHLGAKA